MEQPVRTVSARFVASTAGPFGRSFAFSGVERVLRADRHADVLPLLDEVEAAVASGLHAAGYVSYEAASALNPDLPYAETAHEPLAWFAIFRDRQSIPQSWYWSPQSPLPPLLRRTTPDADGYAAAVTAIREAISRGETYQVNYTLRQTFNPPDDLEHFFKVLCQTQQAPFCAMIETGETTILSASPELFFTRQGEEIIMRPMKGTARRAAESGADLAVRSELQSSVKDRAENLMIVDLVRNDLSRLAVTASVKVVSLFDIETYPTLHQMTSTISARLHPQTTTRQIFSALFPCGSVTGAPKKKTMEIIRTLEQEPRGLYCGAIGFVSPGESSFSVAIRTVVVDHRTHLATIGIGSGVTWDSTQTAEYAESCAKSAFLDADPTPFFLIESLRRNRDGGYYLLKRHLQRLAASAAYFSFPFEREEIVRRLLALDGELRGLHKVRLLLDRAGTISLTAEPLLPVRREGPLRVGLSPVRVRADDPFLFHKTTRRELYTKERARLSEVDEVLFCNEGGEVTEGTISNLVIRLRGRLWTPKLSCGLLPGTLRGELIEQGILHEAVIDREMLLAAEGMWLINSVRGWRRGTLVGEG